MKSSTKNFETSRNRSKTNNERLWFEGPHPGGTALTERIAALTGAGEGKSVLDVASGHGESAAYLMHAYGCRVVGIDMSQKRAAEAYRNARAFRQDSLAAFLVGDAVALPFRDGSFDVLLCECSFSLLNRQNAAMKEFHRVLRGGGRIGLADFYLKADPRTDKDEPSCFCPPGTGTEGAYRALMCDAGFREIGFEDQTERLKELFLDMMLAGGADMLCDKLPDRSHYREYTSAVGYCVATAVK